MLSRDSGAARPLLALSILVCELAYTGAALAAAAGGPAVIDVGPVAVTPTLGLDSKYSDNIYLQETDTTSSWIYLVRPAVVAQLQDRSNLYRLSYDGEAAWYDEDSENDRNNYFNQTFSGDIYILPAERWIATAYASYALLHEDRGTGLTEGQIGNNIPEPVEYDQTDVGGTIEYGSGVGRINLNANYMDRVYQNFREFTRSRDVEETRVGATFFYPIAPKTDILLDYSHADISYPNPFENLPALDSTEDTIQAGIEWEITPNMTSRAQAGGTQKNFDDSERDEWSGLTWTLSLLMQPTEHDTVTITGQKAPEETSLQGDFINRESLTTTWDHSWSDRVGTSLSGTVARERYEGSIDDRDDYLYNVTARVDYEFRRWVNTYMSYSYDDKDSNAEDLSYQQNVFMIGVDLSL
jgi:hypothetical protein